MKAKLINLTYKQYFPELVFATCIGLVIGIPYLVTVFK